MATNARPPPVPAGFTPLAANPNQQYMSPNDATIDIPLETVATQSSQTGLRNPSTSSSRTAHEGAGFGGGGGGGGDAPPALKEKHSMFSSRGRRKIMKINSKGQAKSSGDEDGEGSFTRMGVFYSKILNSSVVTRYFIFILPLAICIAAPIVIGATVAPHASVGGVRMVWLFVWIEIVWVSLWISKLVARFLPWVFQFFAGVVSSGTRKYALVLRSLEMPLTLAGWALCSLATFIPLMTRNPDTREAAARQAAAKQPVTANAVQEWQTVVQHILAALLVCTLILLAEKVLVQLISINYHRKQFDSKIKDSKHNVHLLSLLYDASRTLFPAYCNEFAEEDYIINDSILATKSHKRSPGGSATPLRLIADVGRFGDKITSAFGNVAHEITGKNVFNPNSAHSIVVEALEKRASSEALARRLWMSFVVEGRDALFQEDLVEVLGANRRTEAEECFASLDRDNNGDISLDEMILTVTELGRERKSIASSMHDVDQAINVLDSLLGTVVLVICIFVFVAFLNRSFTTTLATAGTALLSLSFVFAGTCQEVLGSCIFLFVKHPYDVGDRVEITNEQLTVEQISLLYTTFKRVMTGKMVQIPNVVLNTLWIDNITRSKAMREQLSMFVNFDTSFEDIRALKDEMQAFVINKDNSRDFQPDVEVEVLGIAEMNKLELRIEIKHKGNWANEAIRAARRSKFMCALVLAIRKVPIYGPGAGDAALGDASKPSYSVAISHEQAQQQKDAFATAKDAKRLFPAKKADADTAKSSAINTSASSGNLTNRATEALNSRDPARDPARDEVLSLHRIRSNNNNTNDGRPSADVPRSSEDRQALDEVSELMRRESNRGRRKASSSAAAHAPLTSPPTIPEQQAPVYGSGYQDYASSSPTANQPGNSSYQVQPSQQQQQQQHPQRQASYGIMPAVQPGQQYRRPPGQDPNPWGTPQQWRQ